MWCHYIDLESGRKKEVKNLAWVRAYARHNLILRVTIGIEDLWAGARLCVEFKDKKFISDWASRRILGHWLTGRHSWHGAPVHIMVGTPELAQYVHKFTLGKKLDLETQNILFTGGKK